MPGLIKADDIASVKERSSIEEVVREHVTLRRRGVNLIGLCPFHDEKTPSFNVNPAAGFYHCFGCGKSGDVINFVMEVEHLSFAEAVERLAAKLGMELHYEQGAGPRTEGGLGRRMRLLEAHRVAEEFYRTALIESDDARAGRAFLRGRGFYSKDTAPFGVGYAPRGFDILANHLRDKGFSVDDMVTAGLVGRSDRGRLYDRFRGRVVWPIRDVTGDTIGFGARRIYDDDRIEAKYLNTAETPIYKKTQVLYGLDLAKKAISTGRRAVIVEGYTDVMAAHLSGVTDAVATCGTAFGSDHVRMLRRILRDANDQMPPRVVFTFDGDAAGQAAAMKAFNLNQEWGAQSFVAVAKGGQDPCELRQSEGEGAVRDLVEDAEPIFDFATRTTLARYDLNTPDGRVLGMRAIAPILGSIKDGALRTEYEREAAGRIGVTLRQLVTEVQRENAKPARKGRDHAAGSTPDEGSQPARPTTGIPMPDRRDPAVQAEAQFLELMTQFPSHVPGRLLGTMRVDDFVAPAHHAMFTAMLGAGPPRSRSLAAWLEVVRAALPEEVQPLLARYAVAALPTLVDPQTGAPEARYARSLIVRVRESAVRRQIEDAMSQLRRVGDDADQARAVSGRLTQMQRDLVDLRALVD